jgi:transcriptional regulator with XRE-family HTH domain
MPVGPDDPGQVKTLRRARKLTQAALAKKLGVHRVYVVQIEGRTKLPSLAVLHRLAKVLKVKVQDLLV